MTTLRTIKLACPVCGNHFASRAVASTDSRGGKRTDFHEQASGMQPLPYLVHVCQRCGYAGSEDRFSDSATVGPMLERRVWDELAPRLRESLPIGSEKYEFAAKVATWQGASSNQVGELWLRAAWCCVDEGDVEAERYFRRHAARAFEQALASYDDVDRDARAAVTYLVGELWRRIGDSATAGEWFDRVPDEITCDTEQRWILTAAKHQKEAPREWFG